MPFVLNGTDLRTVAAQFLCLGTFSDQHIYNIPIANKKNSSQQIRKNPEKKWSHEWNRHKQCVLFIQERLSARFPLKKLQLCPKSLRWFCPPHRRLKKNRCIESSAEPAAPRLQAALKPRAGAFTAGFIFRARMVGLRWFGTRSFYLYFEKNPHVPLLLSIILGWLIRILIMVY